MAKGKKTLTYDQKNQIIEYYKQSKTSFVRLAEIFTAKLGIVLNARTTKNIIES